MNRSKRKHTTTGKCRCSRCEAIAAGKTPAEADADYRKWEQANMQKHGWIVHFVALGDESSLAEAGADVVIASRHENELKTALAEILKGTDRKGAYFVADMAKRGDVGKLAAFALDKMGKIDILINNAGTNVPQAVDEITDVEWDRIMEINLNSVMSLTRALVPQMKTRKWGRIIHISSIMAFVSNNGRNVYSATKAALVGMARSSALDLGAHGMARDCAVANLR